jgi:hypothetical protein
MNPRFLYPQFNARVCQHSRMYVVASNNLCVPKSSF